jgi:hypothetical protein
MGKKINLNHATSDMAKDFIIIANIANETPNDMDLGKQVRLIIEKYNEQPKAPFTEDYTQ